MGYWIRPLKSKNSKGSRIELEDSEWLLRLNLLKDTGEFTDQEIAQLEISHDPRDSDIFDVTADRAVRCAEALVKFDRPDFMATLRFKGPGRLQEITRTDLWEFIEFLQSCGGFWVCDDL